MSDDQGPAKDNAPDPGHSPSGKSRSAQDKSADKTKEERLAEALRANLRRRKAAAKNAHKGG
ncbi:MAG: hypothetical protein JJ902_18415 [Roseibium sp.]|nr:hypothetical protein [Roseibium sp.]